MLEVNSVARAANSASLLLDANYLSGIVDSVSKAINSDCYRSFFERIDSLAGSGNWNDLARDVNYVLSEFSRWYDCIYPHQFYPDNWTIREVYLANRLGDWYEMLVLAEGTPMYRCIPNHVLHKLLLKSTKEDRRHVLRSNKQSVGNYCLRQLRAARGGDKRLSELCDILVETWRCSGGGYFRQAQAMACNIMDTCMRTFESSSMKNGFTGRGHQNFVEKCLSDVAPPNVCRCLVLGCVWSSYGQYSPYDPPDTIAKLNRHVSAHTVSTEQYTQINCLLSLMQATSLLLYEIDNN